LAILDKDVFYPCKHAELYRATLQVSSNSSIDFTIAEIYTNMFLS